MDRFWPFIAGLVASVLLTRVVRVLAARWNMVDAPDGQRKLQARAVPLWGGVATFGALLVGLLVAREGSFAHLETFDQLVISLLVSTTLIFAVGFIDDCYELRGRLKLLLQITAVLPLIAAGHYVQHIAIFTHEFDLGLLGVPLTMLWYVGCINALNLLDGMDGNASVIGLVGTIAVAVIGWHHGHEHVSLVALALAGSLAGFLFYNRPPATIYLGDCGSTVIGLLLAVLCVEGAMLSTGAVRVAVPVVIMTIPILDTTLAVVRRRLTGRPFDAGDRGHIHHRLLERGMNTWQALGLMASLCLITGVAATVAAWLNSEPLAWVAALLVIVGMAQLRYFGNYELGLVKLFAAAQLGNLASSLNSPTTARELAAQQPFPQQSFDQAWQQLTSDVGRWRAERLEFHLHHPRLSAASRQWSNPGHTHEEAYQWRMAMTFALATDAHYELIVSGSDKLSTEPWYLAQLSTALHRFGRAWVSRLDDADVLPLHVFVSKSETDERRRDAA
ncbi:MAG: undecaprenyl/decaprenyl-phosphate alpha-N-acetylglucosaminyl 1-phosphate transferase [Planctomycetes bacterium]|nr:undecaprenyl/decaprenyl-phosphate alpha-N-acetylglucosaminyl 1-phosphate transferase [Planctomycetota bacterium]